MIKRLDHVGIVVNNLNESIILYEKILGVKPFSLQDVPTQRVRVAFFNVGGGVEIELIEPSEPDSSVARFLEKRGQGVHHICFEVDELDEELKSLVDKGIELVDQQGRDEITGRIGFIHPKSTQGVLIELVQFEA